jgi:hypothetical protein
MKTLIGRSLGAHKDYGSGVPMAELWLAWLFTHSGHSPTGFHPKSRPRCTKYLLLYVRFESYLAY